LITCRILCEALNTIKSLGLDEKITYTVLFMHRTGYGRIAITKYTGLQERRVRRVIETIESSPLTNHIIQIVDSLDVVEFKTTSKHYYPVLYSGLEQSILDTIRKNIVLFRDYIVILTSDPWKLEVIGVVHDNTREFPGLPENLRGVYLNKIDFVENKNGVLIYWRKYKRFIDDAVVLTAITHLCKILDIEHDK